MLLFSIHSQRKKGLIYDCFQIQVTYQTDLFLDKNKDYAIPEHASILNASKCSFVSGLFPPLHEDATKSKKFSSVATQFKVRFVLPSI